MRVVVSTAIVLFAWLPVARGEDPKPRRYDVMSMGDQEQMGRVLAPFVAQLEVVPDAHGSPLSAEPREGFAAVIGRRQLAALSTILEGATRAKVSGPRGTVEAVVRLIDPERRVAILETTSTLSRIGLYPPAFAPKRSLRPDRPIFVLLPDGREATVLTGFVMHDGQEPEYEGYPRITLQLSGGPPVFDDRARLIGFARGVPSDFDPRLVVPLEVITQARTATRAERPTEPEAQTPPWWTRSGGRAPEPDPER